jgi:hypothetical protein
MGSPVELGDKSVDDLVSLARGDLDSNHGHEMFVTSEDATAYMLISHRKSFPAIGSLVVAHSGFP